MENNKENAIEYKRLNKLNELNFLNQIESLKILQSEIMNDNDCKIIVDVNPKLKSVIAKMDSYKKIKEFFLIARGLANNKVNFDGNKYKALKSTNVRKYFIEGELKNIDTDFADVFNQEMIILPRTVAYLQAMLKEKEIICLDRIYYLIPNSECNLNFILGILNSKLTNTWFEYYYNTTKVSGNYFDLNGNQIGSIPIPTATKEQQKEIITLVDKILDAKKQDSSADTTEWEKQIDQKVYELYGLTSEEIAIVEGK